MFGEPVEHAARADRRELRAVADHHQLRARPLDDIGELVEAVGVGHACLVEEDRRVRVEGEPAVLGPGDESVKRERLSGERGTVLAEALGGRAGHGDPERLVSGGLLGTGGGVDHDALAGAGRADEDRSSLGAGDDLEGVGLLVAEIRADALGELAGGDRPCVVAYVPAGGLGEPCDSALDRLLLGAQRERRHSPALQREHASFGDHRVRLGERVGGSEFSGGLLEQHGP